MSVPMPFVEVDTGCEVEYMAGGLLGQAVEALRAEGDGGAGQEPVISRRVVGRCV